MTLQYIVLTLFVATAVLGGSPVLDKPPHDSAEPLRENPDHAAPPSHVAEVIPVTQGHHNLSADPLNLANSSKLSDDPAVPTTITPPPTTPSTPTTTPNSTTTTTTAPTTPPTTSTMKPSTTTPATSTTPTTSTTSTTTTSTTTTTKKPTTTSTTPSPPPTSTPAANTTTTTVAPTTMKPIPNRHFDGASFTGGIVLSVGMMCIGLVAWKFYKARHERTYHTL